MISWRPESPYNELPPLPPKAEVESKRILKLTVEARASLASLDQAAAAMTNPQVLLNTIPLLEAQASSEVENIVTTTDDLFRHAQDETAADPATREALSYRTALLEGFKSVSDRGIVTSNTAMEVCSIIKKHRTDLRTGEGTFIGDPATRKAVYTPPRGRTVIEGKLAAWENFANAPSELDPLVRMALAHYQFEAIHPFDDGNGRTGRILNVLMLVSSGLLRQPVLHHSKYIIGRKTDYYDTLLAVTAEESWEDWVEYMLEAVRATSTSTLSKIGRLQTLQNDVKDWISTSISGAHIALLDVLFEQPYCRISNVMEQCHVSRPTATKWLKALVQNGVLHDMQVGREILFINWRFMDLLINDDPET
ncbi:Fic family protein [Zhihengliuella salsuginis]|uniref:Adenosine monophosphate-protein transferase n=1 Tax=Zhihengliuella salsuginis TaxID=578222 RepID=A0ABQ3GIG3_9MICC|nr:Fic/DOC family N-terminal domain-containing protein [Zhihengliuella salsuginis]GHD05318.1 adenosine monophosphate-protein transferase [Zhihengliuella salsuginis]